MFYDKFKLLCDAKGVSCNKAALEIGLSNATPTKWKKTGATPDGATLAKVARYFNVSVNLLLEDFSDGEPIEFTVSIDELRNLVSPSSHTPSGGNIKEKAPTPVSESGQLENIVKLAGRDGSYMEKRVSDEQLALFQSMLDQMKPVDDDSI